MSSSDCDMFFSLLLALLCILATFNIFLNCVCKSPSGTHIFKDLGWLLFSCHCAAHTGLHQIWGAGHPQMWTHPHAHLSCSVVFTYSYVDLLEDLTSTINTHIPLMTPILLPLLGFPLLGRKHYDPNEARWKGILIYTSLSWSIIEGSQDRNSIG